MRSSLWLALALLTATAQLVSGDEKKDEPKPAALPVTATLTNKKATYTLDLGGKSADDYRKTLKDAAKTGKLPPAPGVDFVLELKNTSDKEVRIWTTGDPVMVNLDMTGKGAVSAAAQQAFTQEFRLPMSITLAPGKSHEIPIKSLTYGFRGAAQRAYWLQPGEFTLTASFQTGISPAPKGTKDNGEGFGTCTITSGAVKFMVEAAK